MKNKALPVIRFSFLILCLLNSALIWYNSLQDSFELWQAIGIGGGIGLSALLLETLLKRPSLKRLLTLTLGLTLGAWIAFLLSTSPLLAIENPEIASLVHAGLYLSIMYISSSIALRSKDELRLMPPYSNGKKKPAAQDATVLDVSSLIDGRIVAICESQFMTSTLIVPSFIVDELRSIANASDALRQAKGQRGLANMDALRIMPHIDLRIEGLNLGGSGTIDSRIIAIAKSASARLLTMDFNLAKLAEAQGIKWLNMNSLVRSLTPALDVGEAFDVNLVKSGKESSQAVGYLRDGSMVVVNDAAELIGQTVQAQVSSILPSAGGKMIFAKLVKSCEPSNAVVA